MVYRHGEYHEITRYMVTMIGRFMFAYLQQTNCVVVALALTRDDDRALFWIAFGNLGLVTGFYLVVALTCFYTFGTNVDELFTGTYDLKHWASLAMRWSLTLVVFIAVPVQFRRCNI